MGKEDGTLTGESPASIVIGLISNGQWKALDFGFTVSVPGSDHSQVYGSSHI